MANDTITRAQGARYILTTLFFFAIFASTPFFLASVDMSEPAKPAPPVIERPPVAVLNGAIVFRDAAAQSREFMSYYHTIEITPEQEAIKKEVLTAMPAACCSGSTAYTCCCPCNLSKTIWGLSNLAIGRHGADARELRTVVDAWMAFVNPDGFRGNACYQGGCDSRISGGGCGGMKEDKLAV